MSTQVVPELKNSHSPEAYVSNFTFFEKPEVREAISLFNAQELCVAVCQKPSDCTRYIHELWRIGHISTLYEFLTMNMGCIGDQSSYPFRNFLELNYVKDDIIANVAIMMHMGNVSLGESYAFLYDISVASFNAQNGLPLEYEPMESDCIKEKVTQMMLLVESVDFSKPEQTADVTETI